MELKPLELLKIPLTLAKNLGQVALYNLNQSVLEVEEYQEARISYGKDLI